MRQSGKNSADIRLVVDALDLCYTKSHVNTFVIISGDSDFSPLVSKLRENDKKVIGVGVKQSTSDLLIANCDEFIFYDDLAREGQRAAESRRDSRDSRGAGGGQRRTPEEERRRKEEQEARKTQAVELVVETFDALMAERGDGDRIWASVLKDALKRRKPDFNESYYGFRAFGNLLEEAQSRGFLDVGREEKSGTYVYRDSAHGRPAPRQGVRAAALQPADEAVAAAAQEASAEPAQGAARGSRGGPQEGTRGRSGRDRKRGGRRDAERAQDDVAADGDREPAQDARARPRPCYRGRMLNPGKASRRKRETNPAPAPASRPRGRRKPRRTCVRTPPRMRRTTARQRRMVRPMPTRPPPSRRPRNRPPSAPPRPRAAPPAGQGRQDGGRHHGRRRRCDWRQGRRCRAGARRYRRRAGAGRGQARAQDRRASASSAQDGRVLGRLSPVAVPGARVGYAPPGA